MAHPRTEKVDAARDSLAAYMGMVIGESRQDAFSVDVDLPFVALEWTTDEPTDETKGQEIEEHSLLIEVSAVGRTRAEVDDLADRIDEGMRAAEDTLDEITFEGAEFGVSEETSTIMLAVVTRWTLMYERRRR